MSRRLSREEAWARRVMREDEAERARGLTRRSVNCFSCGRWKARPSAVCGSCGDDPVTHNGDRKRFDRGSGHAD